MHALVTGKRVSGMLTLPDGREIDVTPETIYLDTPEDVAAVCDAIGAKLGLGG